MVLANPEGLREATVLLTNQLPDPESLREAAALLANQLSDPGSLREATVFLLTNQLPGPRDFTGGDSVSYPIGLARLADPDVGRQFRLFRTKGTARARGFFLYAQDENT